MAIINLKCPRCGHPYAYDAVELPAGYDAKLYTCENSDCSFVFEIKEEQEDQ